MKSGTTRPAAHRVEFVYQPGSFHACLCGTASALVFGFVLMRWKSGVSSSAMSIFPPYYELSHRLRVGETDLEGSHEFWVHRAREGRPPVNNNDFDLSFFEHSLDTIGLSLWII